MSEKTIKMPLESYKTVGVVLHSIKHSESGHIVYMYTEHRGRCSYYVYGNRAGRPVVGKSKVVLEPLTVLEFVGSEGSRGSMHRIKEVVGAKLMPLIAFDIRKSTQALFMAEVIYRIVRDETPSPLFFDFLTGSIKSLNLMDSGISNFHLFFMVNLSRFLGFYPLGEYSEGMFFDISRGEFCTIKPRHENYIDSEGASLLYRIMNCRIDALGEIGINRHERVYLLNSMIRFFGYHHESAYNIASVKILGEIF